MLQGGSYSTASNLMLNMFQLCSEACDILCMNKSSRTIETIGPLDVYSPLSIQETDGMAELEPTKGPSLVYTSLCMEN